MHADDVFTELKRSNMHGRGPHREVLDTSIERSPLF